MSYFLVRLPLQEGLEPDWAQVSPVIRPVRNMPVVDRCMGPAHHELVTMRANLISLFVLLSTLAIVTFISRPQTEGLPPPAIVVSQQPPGGENTSETDVEIRPLRFLKQEPNGVVRVAHPGLILRKMKLHDRDQILELDRMPVRSIDDFYSKMFRQRHGGHRLEFTVLRSGKRLSLETDMETLVEDAEVKSYFEHLQKPGSSRL
jgi:hypothetical protein